MYRDIHGLTVAAASEAAVQAIDHTLDGYLAFRADLPGRVEAMMRAGPDCGLAHAVKGYLTMLAYDARVLPVARAAAAAVRLSVSATPREQAHAAALTAWVAGDADKPGPRYTATSSVRRRAGSRCRSSTILLTKR